MLEVERFSNVVRKATCIYLRMAEGDEDDVWGGKKVTSHLRLGLTHLVFVDGCI